MPLKFVTLLTVLTDVKMTLGVCIVIFIKKVFPEGTTLWVDTIFRKLSNEFVTSIQVNEYCSFE